VSSFSRGKHFISLDLKAEEGKRALQSLTDTADVFVESFRPGVATRLGAGYEELAGRNPRLIYCSLTGYGQSGPLSQEAGHDLNYLALTGILGAIGPADRPPTAPLNLLADFAGGSLFATIGILAALHERNLSGKGQHIDAAMIDGCMSLMAMHYSVWGSNVMPERGTGWLAGSAPYYRCYLCSDGRYISVGSLEPQFFAALWADIGDGPLPDQMDMACWGHIEKTFASAFAASPRDEWATRYAGKDVCVFPVLDPSEVWQHPHIKQRFPGASAHNIPAAPAFSRTPISPCATDYCDKTDEILAAAGLSATEIQRASPATERQRMNAGGWPVVLKD
jgi:alpha-methylacyl-CoA racemase